MCIRDRCGAREKAGSLAGTTKEISGITGSVEGKWKEPDCGSRQGCAVVEQWWWNNGRVKRADCDRSQVTPEGYARIDSGWK
jgi:hypothetical protein